MGGLCVDYAIDVKLSTRIVNNGAGFGTVWTMWTMVRLVLNKSNKYIELYSYTVIWRPCYNPPCNILTNFVDNAKLSTWEPACLGALQPYPWEPACLLGSP